MHDAHAVLSLRCAVIDEVGQSRLCLVDRQTVQVNFRLDAVAAALQLAHRSLAHVLAMKWNSK